MSSSKRIRKSRRIAPAQFEICYAANGAYEKLEQRMMLASWTQLTGTHSPPASLGTAELMTDGTVLAHGSADTATKNWYKLTPDSTGNYANGTWTTLAQGTLERLAYPANNLMDGRIFVLGGEYSGAGTSATWTNTGEIYNPITNTWTTIPNYPASMFGDDPTVLLNDGRILAGNLTNSTTKIYDPATNTWSSGPTKLNSDRSDEETWIKMGDDSVLSYDVFSAPRSQRYVPSSNSWVSANSAPTALQTSGGSELGPGFRLPDGRAVQIGGNAHNAIYNPATNTWAALLDTPGNIGGNDAPGAELPNGHILYAAGDTSTNFNAPTTYFDMDPVNNTITAITAPTGGATQNKSAFLNTMLMLPTGQVLLTTNAAATYIYTPDGSPNDAWRPVVGGVTNNNNGTFTLTGSQLNGVSEGASFGDDAEMSTNFPIIRLTDANGIVKYARTSNWNTAGVGANGSTSVNFTLPAGVTDGAYKLNVIGSGIASKDVLVVITGGAIAGNNVTLQIDPGNSSNEQVLSGATSIGSFPAGSFVSSFVVGDNAADTINVNGTFNNMPVTVQANDGDDTINIGGGNLVSNISANVSVVGGNGNDAVNFDDSSGTTASTYTLGNTSLTDSAQPSISYTFAAESLSLIGGTNDDTITVPALSIPATVNGGGGNDTINLSLSSVSMNVAGGNGTDSAFIAGSGATDTLAVSSTSVSGDTNVSYAADLENLEIDASGGADNLTVNSTSATTAITLDGGAGADVLDVEGTAVGVPVTIVDSADGDSITVNNGAAQFSGSGNAVSTVSIGAGGSLDASSGPINVNTLNLSGGTLTGSTAVNITGSMTWTAGSSSGTGPLNISTGATMTDSVPGTSHSKALGMIGSGSLAAGGSRLLVTSGFSYFAGGVFDLNDNDMIVDYVSGGPQIASIANAISSARHGSAWDGAGLTSSFAKNASPKITTLGAMEATDYKTINPGATTFDGETIDNTAVLIKYTYYGDTNFNGKVDGGDYAHIDGTFTNEGTAGNIGGWINGDFDYNGKVDGADYALIDAAFGAEGATILRPALGGSPASIITNTPPVKKTPASGVAKH